MKQVVIIGAGPAGLTAALELLRRTGLQPIVLEASDEIGGLSRTVRYKGNRMDIGGHRFFSRSDRVMQWWADLMPPAADDLAAGMPVDTRAVSVPAKSEQEPPLRGMGPLASQAENKESSGAKTTGLGGKGDHKTIVTAPAPVSEDLVMLVRPRRSRIYYLRRFFDYPINLSRNTIRNLGKLRILRIACSYMWSRLRPITPETSLQDFLINRFGRELYLTFFKSYTEKVWGVPCDRISAAWGAQRIKGLSLTTAVRHFLRTVLNPRRTLGRAKSLAQEKVETSLIDRFLYPKYGPGQLWELVAEKIVAGGGELHLGWRVNRLVTEGDTVTAAECVNQCGERKLLGGCLFLSTMPMRELTTALESGGAKVPRHVREVSEGLQYRDFITVGVLADRLDVIEADGTRLRDTWIYIQEPDVLLGRVQIYNNWSPYLVSDPEKIWIGLEYFCDETDPLWHLPDDDMKAFAIGELEQIGILRRSDVTDAHVVRVPKSYPAYFGTYKRFSELRQWVDSFENLYLIGRNGMHKYNNQDHSILTAMAVVDGIVQGRIDREALWNINTEQESHETGSAKSANSIGT